MAQTFRHPEILDIARREGRVTVEDLASRFGVTLQTIRRDLGELADMGKLERVHGGAIPASSTTNIEYQERRNLNREAKEAIARAAANLVPENAAVFLNIGTTTEAVARALLGHRGIMVVTNNINVANTLSENPGAHVVVAGGSLRRSDGGLIGSLTNETVSQFKFDLALVGCSAIDGAGELLDYDLAEVGVSRTVLKQSRRVALVADHSKFSRHAPARIGSLAEVDVLVTDRPPPAPLIGACAGWDTEIILAAAEPVARMSAGDGATFPGSTAVPRRAVGS